MAHCVLLACYLPSMEKAYVVTEILAHLRRSLGVVPIYVGIQDGSHPETEQVLRAGAPFHPLHVDRVPPHLHVDSDAAAFVAALELLRTSGDTYERCYFIHTKAITSGADDLRRDMLEILLDEETVSKALAHPRVGSFGPRLTISRSPADRRKMICWARFTPGARLLKPMSYFYVHTLWVAKGSCIELFLHEVNDDFFTTPIPAYSDRYFGERDLPHVVETISGLRPSYRHLAGNYTTDYVRTRTREYLAHLMWWWVRNLPRRALRRVRDPRFGRRPQSSPTP